MCNAESQVIFCDLLPVLVPTFYSIRNGVSMLLRYGSDGILHSAPFSSIHADDDAHVLDSII